MRAFIFSIMVLASTQAMAAGKTCATKKPFQTVYKISAELPEPLYDLKSSLRDINKDKNFDDWITRNSMQKVWKSSDMSALGYAEGAAGLVTGFVIDVQKLDRYGVYYCLYIKHVEISMMFRTKIVIPRNFKKGGCRFNTVHEHEHRHYVANRETAQKFMDQLKNDLPTIVHHIENADPYLGGKNFSPHATVERIKGDLKSIIEVYVMEGMAKELRDRNNLIDTPEEYAAAGPKMQACKD